MSKELGPTWPATADLRLSWLRLHQSQSNAHRADFAYPPPTHRHQALHDTEQVHKEDRIVYYPWLWRSQARELAKYRRSTMVAASYEQSPCREDTYTLGAALVQLHFRQGRLLLPEALRARGFRRMLSCHRWH